MTENPVARFFVRWSWAIVPGFVIAFGLAETRWQVQQMMNRQATEAKQWELIRETLKIATGNSSRLQAIEMKVHEVITAESLERWGRFQLQVQQNSDAIRELERRPR